jgi:hypothetical protein
MQDLVDGFTVKLAIAESGHELCVALTPTACRTSLPDVEIGLEPNALQKPKERCGAASCGIERGAAFSAYRPFERSNG